MENTSSQCPEWQKFLNKIFPGKKAHSLFRRVMSRPLSESFVTAFINDRCVKADGLREQFGDLYRSYLDWHDANMAAQPMLKRRFMELVGRQFEVHNAGGNTFVNGLKLKDSELVAERL